MAAKILVFFAVLASFPDFGAPCAPPLSIGSSSDYYPQHSPSGPVPDVMSALRAFGNPTHANAGPLALDKAASSTSIKDPVDLFCYDFDEKCRWRNMEGLLIDELDWFQGSGFLDESKLRLATGTEQAPDGFYGIVATDKVQIAANKAVLVSDVIDCQMGPSELRFMYWTSPGVKIHVCTKTTDKIYPMYDFCAPPVETGDPGPAYVSVPDLDRKPFQIFIRAENFVMESNNLQGGFAIIDNIEYYGDFCSTEMNYFNNGVEFVPLGGPFHDQDDSITGNSSGSLPVDPPSSTLSPFAPLDDDVETSTSSPDLVVFKKPAKTRTDSAHLSQVKLLARQQQRRPPSDASTPLPFTTERSQFTPLNAQACRTLNCTFSGEICEDFLRKTDWKLAHEPVGNPATGIRGDASLLPYNRAGSFAYVAGPKLYSRFRTERFEVDEDVFLVFSYYKVAKNADFRLVVKKQSEVEEQILFTAPPATIESRRWFRESRKLTSGVYDYLAFDVENLPVNSYVGIDQLFVLDLNQQPFCHVIQETDFISSFDGHF